MLFNKGIIISSSQFCYCSDLSYTPICNNNCKGKMADELSPYRINVDAAEARRIEEGALGEEKKLEAGAYGYVYKVVVGGVERIAKKLHRNLTNRSEVSAREVDSVEAKFKVDILILSDSLVFTMEDKGRVTLLS